MTKNHIILLIAGREKGTFAIMSFRQRLNLLNPEKKIALIQYLRQWSRQDKTAVFNLIREHFLGTEEMDHLITAILSHREESAPLSSLKPQLRQDIYGWLQFQGGVVRGQSPSIISTVLPERRLRNFLMTHYGLQFCNNTGYLEAFISDLMQFSEQIASYPAVEHFLIRSASCVFWVVWNEADSSRSAFDHLNDYSAWEIGKMMQLTDPVRAQYTRFIAFTFRYHPEEGKTTSRLFRPTICDADFNPKFRPPEAYVTNHGYIFPPYQKQNDDGPAFEVHIPEAVGRAANFSLGKLNRCFPVN